MTIRYRKGPLGAARLLPLFIGLTACVAGCDEEALDEDDSQELVDELADDAPASLEELGCISPAAPEATPADHAIDEDRPQAFTADAEPSASAQDYAALTAGVTTLAAADSPAQMILTNASAFLVLHAAALDRPVVAASRVDLGKIVAFGHETYMNGLAKSGDWLKLMTNSINWATSHPAPVIGLDASLTALSTALQGAGYQVKTVTPSTLSGIHVYINTTYSKTYTEADFAAIRTFVKNGGGLLVGGRTLGYTAPADGTILDFPGNRMLQGSGILMSSLFVYDSGYSAPAVPPSDLANASIALDSLTKYAQGSLNLSLADQNRAVGTANTALQYVPILVKDFYKQASVFAAAAAPVITAATPFNPASNRVTQFAVTVQNKLFAELPAAEITAYPGDFPGAIANNIQRETIAVVVDGTNAGRDTRWKHAEGFLPALRSTGAYAAPGEIIKIKIPPALAAAGLGVQIGAHSDELFSKTSWVRFPQVIRTQPLNAAEVSAASAFGGPVYITVPAGKKVGPVSVTLENVVRAPFYVHGVTTPAEWLTIRDYPAPWAEVASNKMILTVPSANVKMLADPVALMNAWDQIMDGQADLVVIPHDRPRAERFLIDRDITSGLMHAGYPINAPYQYAPLLVDITKITTSAWGFWHEIGHNHQWSGWVFGSSADEITVNLFSVYTSEVVFGIPKATAHGALKPADRALRTANYAAQGKVYSKWSADAWLGLEMYLRLQESFGWAPYKAVFGQIEALSVAATPTSDVAKIDTFTVRFAQYVNKDLGPYFKIGWGIPVSQTALTQMAALPAWYHHCPAAVVPGVYGQATGPWTLASAAEQNWFVFTASANDIGKKVHVVTSPGDAQTNTVVEVLSGECGVQTLLGGPSSDVGIHEDWLSTPITTAGKIFVKVTYSNQGYVDDQYQLKVTVE